MTLPPGTRTGAFLTRMATSSDSFRHSSRVGRSVALALLVVAVSVGHVSLPWLMPYSSRQLEFASRAPQEPVTLVELKTAPDTLRTPPIVAAKRDTPPAPAPHKPPAPRAATPQAAPAPAAADEPAPAPSATPLDGTGGEAAVLYAVSGQFGGHAVGGSATLQWKIEPSGYLLSLQVTGSRQFKTVFAWDLRTRGSSSGGSMSPDVYEEEQRTTGEGQQLRAVQFSDNPAQEPGTGPRLDPLSALLKLSNDLHLRPQEEASQPYPVVVRLAGRSLHLSLVREAEEDLPTSWGNLRTEKYVTKYPNEFYFGPQVTLWLAPSLRHAPIRVRVEEQDVARLDFDMLSEPVAFPTWR
ncbi:DUF3108 domain-containing protein [Piscinibacter gummiphilus]|uniref:DUF3108 domain-containing protein n=1 Tax=Piscinibacter gummiphilus TaxID=946333 RepID=A0ABZ0CXR3_9BURK|nr:DUF3108 domain-containing protein [Piscinibacter gummiphilus]WOB09306.1 DUF3108 domain-containing protein [Piscinibacter gummiphilus]